MFLATTARTEFWELSSTPMLFLGEWCLRRDRRQDWEHLERRVLPFPWDDRAAFHRAGEYLDQYGERLLPLLTEFLNSLHGVRHDVRYWRILVGSWLLHALHVYYDRWVCVREALRLYPDLTTILLDRADHRHAVSADMWVRLTLTDDFNLQLYSEVFEALGYRFPVRRLPPVNAEPTRSSWRARAVTVLARAITAVGTAAVRVVPNGVLLNQAAYLAPSDLARLIVSSGLRVWPFEPVDAEPTARTSVEPRRREIVSFPAHDDFERFFVRRMSEALPATVVEDYESKRRLARAVPASAVLATFGGWYGNDMFCFTAAEAQSRGTRLAGIQHGGGYGMLRAAPAERHERRVSDRFLAWGWADDRKHPWVTNVPAASLSRFRTIARKPASATEIVFLATAHPRYLFRFHSSLVASQWEQYYEWQARFFEALPAGLRPHMRFRGNPYFYGMGQAERERLASRFPWLRWDDRPRLRDSLRRARLVVADHPGTSFLQVFTANVPMILFWDPKRWELRREAEEPFDRLRRSGILHDDPESAARAVARAYAATEEWWASRDVAGARSEFVNQFAFYRDEWPRDWSRVLRSVSRRPPEMPVLHEAATR